MNLKTFLQNLFPKPLATCQFSLFKGHAIQITQGQANCILMPETLAGLADTLEKETPGFMQSTPKAPWHASTLVPETTGYLPVEYITCWPTHHRGLWTITIQTEDGTQIQAPFAAWIQASKTLANPLLA